MSPARGGYDPHRAGDAKRDGVVAPAEAIAENLT
jgi:hypothetical protein